MFVNTMINDYDADEDEDDDDILIVVSAWMYDSTTVYARRK